MDESLRIRKKTANNQSLTNALAPLLRARPSMAKELGESLASRQLAQRVASNIRRIFPML
jgi:hypothetical protein